MDSSSLIDVLSQVNDAMAELQAQLSIPSSSETSRLLAAKAREALSLAISMARLLDPSAPRRRFSTGFDSPPPSASGSPRSEGSYRASKEMERREMCKKRKSMPRWSRQVRACSASAMEGPLEDGYSWRKYGQKDILAAKFPRGYYRCTYRNTHACLATKQVQRSDHDSSLFDVTYRGVHTCNQCLQITPNQSSEHRHNQQHLLLQHLKKGLWVKTEGHTSDDQLTPSPSSFSFPSTPTGEQTPRTNDFSSELKLEDRFFRSSYVSPCGRRAGLDLQGLDAEFAEIVSSATSAASSPMTAMDFSLEQIEFGPEFSFEG